MIKTKLLELQNQEAEKAVLGSIAQATKTFPLAAKHIRSGNYFYSAIHRKIWNAMSVMILDNKPIDLITLIDYFGHEVMRDKSLGLAITGLTDGVPTSANCEHYAQIVTEKWQARELIKINTTASDRAMLLESPRKIWDEATESIREIFTEPVQPYDLHATVNSLYATGKSKAWGLGWNLWPLDDLVGSVEAGVTIVIGARPSHGKTTLALQLMDGWLGMEHKIFYESLDMDQRRLDLWRLSRISRTPFHEIKQGIEEIDKIENEVRKKLVLEKEKKILGAADVIFGRRSRLVVRDQAHISPEQIALDIKMAHDKIGIDIFFLDHFHRVDFSGGRNRDERHNMAAGLELIIATCKNLKITPVILAQLSRLSAHDGGREPVLSDLRECGRLEEDADVALLLDYEFRRKTKTGNAEVNKIICAKNKDGATGRVQLEYFPAEYRFTDRIIYPEANK
jgi:replicative DNA helicase